eukprot:TRINITY_DN4743_c0_g1_i2.p1 TRINITY_DN4743_c0_g1~~TRINITY_DN4743_c0_g1_i2.p1  ORF type:complete len:315 (-),score=100.53 TRINITY_DN4743_c0_g1_i2:21-965(-)
MNSLSQGYDTLCNSFIRPPRWEYSLSALGPINITFNDKQFIRKDFELFNPKGQTLQCSHFIPLEYDKENESKTELLKIPCVIYLHGNSGSRVDAIDTIPLLIRSNISLFCFDFSGSGLSEGEFVTLGYNEVHDLRTIIEYLRNLVYISRIALWGRSMGAATSLLYCSMYDSDIDNKPAISGLILDSPFANLIQLAKEFVETAQISVPNIFISIALQILNNSVKKKAELDLYSINPQELANKIKIPALFVHAINDILVRPQHSHQIIEKYSGESDLLLVEGDHNSIRPTNFFNSACLCLFRWLFLNGDESKLFKL